MEDEIIIEESLAGTRAGLEAIFKAESMDPEAEKYLVEGDKPGFFTNETSYTGADIMAAIRRQGEIKPERRFDFIELYPLEQINERKRCERRQESD